MKLTAKLKFSFPICGKRFLRCAPGAASFWCEDCFRPIHCNAIKLVIIHNSGRSLELVDFLASFRLMSITSRIFLKCSS